MARAIRSLRLILLAGFLCAGLTACAGAAIGAAADIAIAAAKVPFKVAGAVVDVAVPDEED